MEYGPVLRWLVVAALLAALGLPVAARLFRRLDGRGAGLALPLALVPLWWGAYLVGHVRYGAVASLAGLGLLVAVAAVAALDRDALRDGRVDLAVSVGRDADGPRVDVRALRQVAVVFLAGFLLVVWVRALDPAVTPLGGEKFLDFGLLQALGRADRLPPEDFWFAGRPVAYYYGGHLLAATVGDLAGTPPRFTYNLALATTYAALVAAVYDLAAAVGHERGLDRRVAGGCGALLVGLASNLEPAGNALLATLPDAVARPVAARIAARVPGQTTGSVLREAGRFHYFDASRVIPGTINEFPLFAWLNGDLHAHMTSTPFLVLAAALGFAYVLTPAAERRRRRLLAFGAVPAVAGLQAVVNTWSFPTVFGLLWLAVTFAPTDPLDLLPGAVAGPVRGVRPDEGLGAEFARPLVAAAPVALAVPPAVVLAAPFLLGPVAGTAGSRSVSLVPAAERSGLGGLLLVHGVFLATFWAYLLARSRGRWLPVGAAVVALAVAASTASAPVALAVLPVLVLGWVALRCGDDVGYETVLLVAGAGLVTIVEVVYVSERAGPLRMNTVFKTYAQVWVIWGVAAGVALPAFVARSADGAVASARTRRGLKAVAAVALLVSASAYAGLALADHAAAGRDDPTLSATAFVAEEHPGAAPAIAHLDGVRGTPTLLSAPATSLPPPGGTYPAPPGMYDWRSSPAASLTGVPTVAGWHHEVGYRGYEAYATRVRAADAMYTADAERRVELMRRHDVRYVWVGAAERARYGNVSFAGVAGVEPVVRTRTVTLYRVDQAALAAR
ncbi:MAG: DUF2298 domain-containing protein [Haloferacaceae archaeon]